MHTGQPGFQCVEGRRLEARVTFAEAVAGTRQALVHICFGGEKPQCDLPGAEAAQRLQRHDQLGFPGNSVIAANEKHAQQIVAHLSGETGQFRLVPTFNNLNEDLLQKPAATCFPPELPDEAVVRHTIQPRAGIIRKALNCPSGERGQQRALHRVLHNVNMPGAHPARKHGDQPTVFSPKEMLDQIRRGRRAGTTFLHRVAAQEPGISCISRISTLDPGEITPGDSFATLIACSILSAETSMYPPTTSFDSTKGPSVAPDSVTTLPPALSFPPMSTILSLNFSFQALNAAYISCICAGEGCCGFCCGVRGALRWINRYFGILVLLWFSVSISANTLTTREGMPIGHACAAFFALSPLVP